MSQVYVQLSEDDSVRYKNEIKSWENHMVQIGRPDLLRDTTITDQKRVAKKVNAKSKSEVGLVIIFIFKLCENYRKIENYLKI